MAEEVLLVEFEQGRPFHVVTREDGILRFWDFDWCDRVGVLCFDMAGFGGESVYLEHGERNQWWAAPGMEIAGSNEGNRVRELPAPYTLESLFAMADESDTIWCDRCDARVPTNDLCEHSWWCDECADYFSPGDPNCTCEHTAPVADQ